MNTCAVWCCRPSVRCSAESEAASGYTPADYISYSTDENKQCHHNAEVWVDAPFDVCYSRWHDWTKLLNYLDLVGQVRGRSWHSGYADTHCARHATCRSVTHWMQRASSSDF